MAPLNLAGQPPDDQAVDVSIRGVQFSLGDHEDEGVPQAIHPLFTEMATLTENRHGSLEWKETARWVKFEESVESGADRWSKPHVPTLSLHSLLELRSCLMGGTVLLDSEADSMEHISNAMLEAVIAEDHMPAHVRMQVHEALMLKHKHLYEKKGSHHRLDSLLNLRRRGSMGSSGSLNNMSSLNLKKNDSHTSLTHNDSDEHIKGNKHFMKKLNRESEAATILVAEADYLPSTITVFLRLKEAVMLGNMTEVNVPTRFIFLIMGPPGGLERFHEIGRSMATLFSDEIFHEMAYRGRERESLLTAIDEFLDTVTVLPPGVWDPKIRIEPPSSLPSSTRRKSSLYPEAEPEPEVDQEEDEERLREEAGLVRTGRLFGGLINDVKRKAPFYVSDFKDALAMQSVASFFFLYFACLAPIITFGGLLGDATGNNIAAMESLVAGLICGVIYGFCSGQPLTILGSTGPVLVFETILYEFCTGMEWNYLSFRMWIGLWSALILLILVAVDASAFVCYITRFTEENFATLIALIFIIKAVEKVIHIGDKYPMNTRVDAPQFCHCIVGEYNPGDAFDHYLDRQKRSTLEDFEMTTPSSNETATVDYLHFGNITVDENVIRNWEVWTNVTQEECNFINGTLHGHGCEHYYPDVFLLSILLFFGTFLISIYLKNFKTAPFLPAKVRAYISDFAVVIAIFAMTMTDYGVGIHTPKLDVPSKFAPTLDTRGWVVSPFGDGQNPWWTCIAALVPALLVCILLFMDQQITAVIVNRKEHKLKKGGGYHLDLFVLSILIAINSVLGLPWFVAATVLAINHVGSLKVESEVAAPGEVPQFLGCRENRVTNILIFLFIGLSVLMTPLLQLIPMPVLYGVFLYMGISALKGIQFFDRILILLMPSKYQPDYPYLREVPLKKVHLFTLIQVACLAGLWLIKSFSQTSILFPIMLVIMIGVRKCLDWVFTEHELKILDDILPALRRKEKMDKKKDEEEKHEEKTKKKTVKVALKSGMSMSIPVSPSEVQLSKELSKTNMWKNINGKEEAVEIKTSLRNSLRKSCKKCNKRHAKGQDLCIPVDADRGHVNLAADLDDVFTTSANGENNSTVLNMDERTQNTNTNM